MSDRIDSCLHFPPTCSLPVNATAACPPCLPCDFNGCLCANAFNINNPGHWAMFRDSQTRFLLWHSFYPRCVCLRRKTYAQLWLDGLQGRGLAANKILDGYKAVTDWPASDFYKASQTQEGKQVRERVPQDGGSELRMLL